MSISSPTPVFFIAAAAINSSPTTLPQIDPVVAVRINVAVLAFTVLAIVLIIRLRVFHSTSVLGPSRRPAAGRLWTLLFAGLIGFAAWQLASGSYVAHLLIEWKRAGIDDAAKRITELLTPKDMAFLSTVPPLVGFLVMLACNAVFVPGNLTSIGFTMRRLPRGIGAGVVAFLVIGPLLIWSMNAMEAYYQQVHYQHPTEHTLLRSLGETREQRYEVLLILGATLVAPFLEELLFRGHFQTFLRELFVGMSSRSKVSFAISEFELVPPLPPPPLLAYAGPGALVPPPAAAPARPWHAWLAIVITSLLFAMMHERWMQPAIFILSLGLGYTYERTGNLWSSIAVHLLFNTVNTLQFLLLFRGH
jgi:membrane protease YdiL (CAAX protease family)